MELGKKSQLILGILKTWINESLIVNKCVSVEERKINTHKYYHLASGGWKVGRQITLVRFTGQRSGEITPALLGRAHTLLKSHGFNTQH